MHDDLVSLIEGCARRVAHEEGTVLSGDFSADTVLFGRDGVFDSLGLVSLVLAVEEAVQDRFGLAVTLADQRAMSWSTSPFRDARSLAAYTRTLIEEAG